MSVAHETVEFVFLSGFLRAFLVDFLRDARQLASEHFDLLSQLRVHRFEFSEALLERARRDELVLELQDSALVLFDFMETRIQRVLNFVVLRNSDGHARDFRLEFLVLLVSLHEDDVQVLRGIRELTQAQFEFLDLTSGVRDIRELDSQLIQFLFESEVLSVQRFNRCRRKDKSFFKRRSVAQQGFEFQDSRLLLLHIAGHFFEFSSQLHVVHLAFLQFRFELAHAHQSGFKRQHFSAPFFDFEVSRVH